MDQPSAASRGFNPGRRWFPLSLFQFLTMNQADHCLRAVLGSGLEEVPWEKVFSSSMIR
jgi:hypothetical protein